MSPPLPRAAPPTAAHPPAPEALEVRCAGCGETLEVEAGLAEFICPDCAMPQALPPELMPQRRRKRALPLPPGARLPCAGCGAVLGVPHGLGRFACPLCAVELVVDGTLLRQCRAFSAVSVVAPPAAVALASPLEVQEEPPRQAIHVGQVQVEPYSQPISVQQAEVEHPARATYGRQAQQERVNHSIRNEKVHVEQLNVSILSPGRKKARFQVGPESVCAGNICVEAPNQGDHAQESQGGPASYSFHADQAHVMGHGDAIARHGKQKAGYAVKPSLICIEPEQIVSLNHAVRVQQGQETPIDEIRAKQEQVEPDNQTMGGSWKSKKKGLMSSSNEELHVRRSKRLAKDSQGLINSEPVQQQTASPYQDLSHPPGFKRITSLPQHQMPEASNKSGNVDLITSSTSSSHAISEAERLPEVRRDLAEVTSNSLHKHQMALSNSSETDQLDVTEPQGRPDSQQTCPPQRPSGLNAHNGQQAQEEPSCDENHAEQVQIVSHSKNVAALTKQKRKGMFGSSNKRSHPRDRLFSGTCGQMTLAASYSRLAASLPVPASMTLPVTTSPIVLTTPLPRCLDRPPMADPEIMSTRRSIRHASTASAGGVSSRPACPEDAPAHSGPLLAEDTAAYSGSSDSENAGSLEQEAVVQKRHRGRSQIPPELPENRREVLRPYGDKHFWMEDFDRKKRMPKGLLGALVRQLYPGMVNVQGVRMAARHFNHYWQAFNNKGLPIARVVFDEFWKRYRLAEGASIHKAEKILASSSISLLSRHLSGVRTWAVQEYYRLVEERIIKEDEARDAASTMTTEQYAMVPAASWIPEDAWRDLCSYWTSREFLSTSARKRANRAGFVGSSSRGGSADLTRTMQILTQQRGEPVHEVGAFLHMKRSKDGVSVIDGPLCSPQLTMRRDLYRDANVLEGNTNWMNGPINRELMLKVTGGKPKGRYAMGDGAVDTDELRSSGRYPNITPSDTARPWWHEQYQRYREREERDRLMEQKLDATLKRNEELDQKLRTMMACMQNYSGWPQPPSPPGGVHASCATPQGELSADGVGVMAEAGPSQSEPFQAGSSCPSQQLSPPWSCQNPRPAA